MMLFVGAAPSPTEAVKVWLDRILDSRDVILKGLWIQCCAVADEPNAIRWRGKVKEDVPSKDKIVKEAMFYY